jgi:hypothetical protein
MKAKKATLEDHLVIGDCLRKLKDSELELWSKIITRLPKSSKSVKLTRKLEILLLELTSALENQYCADIPEEERKVVDHFVHWGPADRKAPFHKGKAL